MVLVILVILNALAGRLRLHLQNYSFLLTLARKTRTLFHVLRRFAYERARTMAGALRCLRGRICTVSGQKLRARTMAGAQRCLRGRICTVSSLKLFARTTGRAQRCLREQEGSGKTERLRAKTMAGALRCLRGRICAVSGIRLRARTTGRARRCLRGRICAVSGLRLRARTMAGAQRCLRGRVCAVSGLRLRAKTMAGALHCLRGRVNGELGKEEVLKKGGTVVGGAGAWTSGGKKGGKFCWRYRRLYLQRHWGTEPALTPRFAVLTDAISRSE